MLAVCATDSDDDTDAEPKPIANPSRVESRSPSSPPDAGQTAANVFIQVCLVLQMFKLQLLPGSLVPVGHDRG